MDDKKKLLWVDHYRPKTLSTLDFHKDQAAHLGSLVTSGDFPHLLFYGPSGAGKKTRVMAVLRELFGASVEKVCCFLFWIIGTWVDVVPQINLDNKSLKIPNKSTSIEITIISSAHHIELNPSDAGNNDRYVVQVRPVHPFLPFLLCLKSINLFHIRKSSKKSLPTNHLMQRQQITEHSKVGHSN